MARIGTRSRAPLRKRIAMVIGKEAAGRLTGMQGAFAWRDIDQIAARRLYLYLGIRRQGIEKRVERQLPVTGVSPSGPGLRGKIDTLRFFPRGVAELREDDKISFDI